MQSLHIIDDVVDEEADLDAEYPIVEIFHSVQGEGYEGRC